VGGHGLFDLFVTHLTEETNTLWRQGPRGMFRDGTAAAGLADSRWRATGFGTVLADFDHDGALDIAVANGRVSRAKLTTPDAGTGELRGPFWSSYAEHNQLFANGGDGHFRDVSLANPPFCGKPMVARGLAHGDIDGDGAVDLLVTVVAGPARLYKNVAPKRGHWLMVRALDSVPLTLPPPPAGGEGRVRGWRDAYGAEIAVVSGGRRWLRWINPGSSYLCSNDPRAHFGLGPTERVDLLEVVWPDGTTETFPGGAVDRLLVLRKGEGKREPSRKR
jgi:enediyne biosynthesis protein E4